MSPYKPCSIISLSFGSLLPFWSRPQSYWLSHLQSLLYCSENNQLGAFSEELRSCSCRYDHSPCQLPPPCSVGEGAACAACATDNHTRCGSCNPGFSLTQGACRSMVADSTENYLGFEMDLQDLELGYLLQRSDRRLEVHISFGLLFNVWGEPGRVSKQYLGKDLLTRGSHSVLQSIEDEYG